MPLIELRDLHVTMQTDEGLIRAVDGIDFTLEPERTLCVVGESGCGKSVTALSIMGLIQMQGGRIEKGAILYHRHGQFIDLTRLDPWSKTMQNIRGNEIAMIFQEPMTSLNPVYTIGDQITEAITQHEKFDHKSARRRAVELLNAVGIPDPGQRVDDYPHRLSGGMRQRAMIAMALSCNPALLIADEPTTALDVTIQAQVLDLMRTLRQEFKMAMMFITHNLGIVARIADDVIVMYLGKVVESASVKELFVNPQHPYTRGLLNSLPSLSGDRKKRLQPIAGIVPDANDLPAGCRFQPRCSVAKSICRSEIPALRKIATNHWVACFPEERP